MKFHLNKSIFLQAKRTTNSLGKRDNKYCSVLALAQAADINYTIAYSLLEQYGRKHGEGIARSDLHKLMDELCTHFLWLQAKWTWLLPDGKCTLQEFVDKHPKGRYYVGLEGHATCVVDGVVMDSFIFPQKLVYSAYELIINE